MVHNICARIENAQGWLSRARDSLHFVPDAAFLDASLKQHPSSDLDFQSSKSSSTMAASVLGKRARATEPSKGNLPDVLTATVIY